MTLTKGQGVTVFTSKLQNVNFILPFLAISQTLFIDSKVNKAGLQVVYGETFKMMWYLVTLTEGKGHSLYLKITKYPFNDF